MHDWQLIQPFITAPDEDYLVVDVAAQEMRLCHQQQCLQSWPVSTASRGTGNRDGSLQTPPGAHRIAEKIGAGAAPGTLFKARQDTGTIADIHHDSVMRDTDEITSRILWLKGIEPGLNQGGDIDSHARFIYIHGTSDEGLVGQPASHGCIRMKNADVIDLFDRVDVETLVYIKA